MRKVVTMLAAGLLFLGPVVVAAQSQSGTMGEPTPGRTPSSTQMQREPSPGSMTPATPSHTQDATKVRKAQEKLKSSGFDPGPIDGNMGPQTKEALRDYQKARGLPQTGMLDRETEEALMASSSTGSTGRGTTSGGSSSGSMGGSSTSPGSHSSPGSSMGGSSSPGSSTPGSSSGGSMGGSSGSESTGGAIRR
jgi:peptidoglycan hydrolase-like protein with peptidoglycan-binding domain